MSKRLPWHLKDQLAAHFPHIQVGRFHLRIGPHTKAMFQVAYAQADAAALMAYFDAHIPERSVLIHPLIDDVLAAHTTEAKWRGPILPLNTRGIAQITLNHWPAFFEHAQRSHITR
jgi:aromatic ring-cleaving dioxygenase